MPFPITTLLIESEYEDHAVFVTAPEPLIVSVPFVRSQFAEVPQLPLSADTEIGERASAAAETAVQQAVRKLPIRLKTDLLFDMILNSPSMKCKWYNYYFIIFACTCQV